MLKAANFISCIKYCYGYVKKYMINFPARVPSWAQLWVQQASPVPHQNVTALCKNTGQQENA